MGEEGLTQGLTRVVEGEGGSLCAGAWHTRYRRVSPSHWTHPVIISRTLISDAFGHEQRGEGATVVRTKIDQIAFRCDFFSTVETEKQYSLPPPLHVAFFGLGETCWPSARSGPEVSARSALVRFG